MKKDSNFSKTMAASIALTTLFFIAISCTPVKKENEITFDKDAATKNIEEANRVFMETLSNSDSVGLANCYTKDAKFMMPNAKAVVGREKIQKVLAGMIKAGMTQINLKPVDVWGNETMLTVENEWFFTGKDGKEIDRGKSLELWKMEDGKWKLFRDCYNSDLPCQPMK